MKPLGIICLILSAWLLIPSIGFEAWFGALCFGIFLTTWARPVNYNNIYLAAELELDCEVGAAIETEESGE